MGFVLSPSLGLLRNARRVVRIVEPGCRMVPVASAADTVDRSSRSPADIAEALRECSEQCSHGRAKKLKARV